MSSKGKRVLAKPSIPRFSPEQIGELGFLLRFLNEKDRDILYLIFVAGKNQCAVQYLLERSQPSIHYDIKRIERRLRFIWYLYSAFDVLVDFLETRANQYDELAVAIMVVMFYTTSFTEAGRVLGMEQMRVRYRFDKVLTEVAQNRHWDMYEVLVNVRKNLNIVRRVYAERGTRSA